MRAFSVVARMTSTSEIPLSSATCVWAQCTGVSVCCVERVRGCVGHHTFLATRGVIAGWATFPRCGSGAMLSHNVAKGRVASSLKARDNGKWAIGFEKQPIERHHLDYLGRPSSLGKRDHA